MSLLKERQNFQSEEKSWYKEISGQSVIYKWGGGSEGVQGQRLTNSNISILLM